MNRPPAPIKLFVVDDHTLFRRGLVALLGQDEDLQVVGEAGDAAQALRLAPALQPDVVLMDNHLPGVSGIDAIKDLRQQLPLARVLMLTVSEDAQDLAMALRNGAHGYLLKTIDGDLLADAIRRAVRGEPVVSLELMGKLVAAFQAQDSPAPADGAAAAPCAMPDEAAPAPAALTPREEEVLREIARGASNKEIARTLDIAETTVKIHVQHILRKLELTSRVQAAVYATDRQRVA
ncbi:DNA-binding response regulator [Rhodococcus sp. SRB_17]|uniref:response regulator n=1 Tax=Acidovorax sp. SRB_24 TaxID=1962700 RepID=UPI00145F2663|nr:response regulator transcription factor [Acidovorax sp. SRB_24]NMM77759.1 DNA-binding response regulator [Acidovorax sp. SRB_24]NMM77789.1 DNA-binding response regulator [Acidovorax sp. SRB_24]NMM90413.1 DNA-binding response regulator [Rhodococcus sp. SRB_17]